MNAAVDYINEDNVIPFPTTNKKKKSEPPKYTKQRGLVPTSPIKNIDDIVRFKEYFMNKSERFSGQNIRDYTLFVLNINVGLRAGDLLHLHVRDITDFNYEQIIIKEQKTRNSHKSARVITLAKQIQDVVREYINSLDNYNEDDYLFGSRKTKRKNVVSDIENYPDANNQPMTVKGLNDILIKTQEDLELNFKFRSHSLRKTFGYQKFMAHRDDGMFLATLQKVYGHSSEAVTLRYIGIEAEEIADVYTNDVL